MTLLATTNNPVTLSQSVARMHQRWRFMVAVSIPDIATGNPSGTLALYGSHEACHLALEEALIDHPGAQVHGEYEHLPNSVINEIVRSQVTQDPVAQALKSLGRVPNPA